ncbi:MAG: hypothetical protein AABN95_22575 [Acidobacteriota bacterium]
MKFFIVIFIISTVDKRIGFFLAFPGFTGATGVGLGGKARK